MQGGSELADRVLELGDAADGDLVLPGKIAGDLQELLVLLLPLQDLCFEVNLLQGQKNLDLKTRSQHCFQYDL